MFLNSYFAEQSWSDQQNAARSSLRSEFFSSERFMYPWTNPPSKIRFNLILAEKPWISKIFLIFPAKLTNRKKHTVQAPLCYTLIM